MIRSSPVKGGSERQPPGALGKNQQQNDHRDQAQNNKTDLNVAQDQAGGRHPVAGQRAVAFFDFFFLLYNSSFLMLSFSVHLLHYFVL